eukprot:scaffold7672_cov114-Isochrysis_galbana.AAC.1
MERRRRHQIDHRCHLSGERRTEYRGGWVKGSWGRAGATGEGEGQRAHLAAMGGDAGAAPPSGGVRTASG